MVRADVIILWGGCIYHLFIYNLDQPDMMCTFKLKGQSTSYEEYLILFSKTLDIGSNYAGYLIIKQRWEMLTCAHKLVSQM